MSTTTTTTATAAATTATTTATTALTPETRQLVLQEEQQHGDDDEPHHCLVCYDVLHYATKTPCQHDEICGVCHLRIRYLHQDKKCPICKTENAQVIVDVPNTIDNIEETTSTTDGGAQQQQQHHHKTFQEYPIWGDDLGSDFHYQEDVGMFFRKEYYETEIRPLFGYHCTEPHCDYDGQSSDKNISTTQEDGGAAASKSKGSAKNTPIRGLQDHLRVKHRKALCQLCVDHQRDFVARLPRFTPNQLKHHLNKGDGKGSAFKGHPLCEFCRPKRFYDLNYLHQHLNKEHYKCHVCEQQGLANQFFKNYKSLEKHFDTSHFLCHDVQCLQARFVVFSNELDLRHHERQVHGGTSTGSSKIQLEFRVRRQTASTSDEAPSDADFNYNLDGQAFVPENLPQTAANATAAATSSPSDVALHPLHVQRTAQLREQAAEWRQANEVAVEAFPSLEAARAENGNSANTGNAPLLVGWASGATLSRVGRQPNVGAVTEEAFPSLGPSESSSKKAGGRPLTGATAKLRANTNNNNRQFAAMRQAAAAPTSSWGTAGAASTPGASSSSFVTTSAVASGNTNRQANLTADNFPSLGPGSAVGRPQPYAAANAFFRQQQQQQKKAPSLNSAADFPPPPSASHKSTVRDRVMGNRGAPAVSNANILQGPAAGPSRSAKATVGDMKATLGSVKYKELKRMTGEFAEGSLDSQGYVDMAASLFDRGYADADFWKFIPTLLSSCPNEYEAQRALQYMENLKRMKNAAANAEYNARAAAPVAAAPSGGKAPLGKPAPTARASAPALGRGKKNAWGTGPAPSVTKATPAALSVAAAASSSTPATGSATKFMAKEAKQQSWQQANAGSNNNNNANNNSNKGGKKKKGKQKNELRDLAFGK